jgi:hypothetical protein
MKFIPLLLIFVHCLFFAQGPFHPPADSVGTSAIHKDSSVFVGWAVSCEVERGYQDIQQPQLGLASTGEPQFAIGKAGVNSTVSLGDGGVATLSFSPPIINGEGWDFAVFENSFSQTFLELAFVEVSSDGINFYRFEATSLTPVDLQMGSFGGLEATHLNNLAGKYRANYGTPFDLEELKDVSGLNVNAISHVRIIDVIGIVNPEFASYDAQGNIVNDPYPTPFPSGGFDLDAIGVIHQQPVGIEENDIEISVFPNPTTGLLNLLCTSVVESELLLLNLLGEPVLRDNFYQSLQLNLEYLPTGVYTIQLTIGTEVRMIKVVKL